MSNDIPPTLVKCYSIFMKPITALGVKELERGSKCDSLFTGKGKKLEHIYWR